MPRHSGERDRGEDDEKERDHSARGRGPPRGDEESGRGDPRRADEEGNRVESGHGDALRADEEGDIEGGHGDARRVDEEGRGSRSGRGSPGSDIEGGHGGPRRADAEGRSERLGADDVRLLAVNPELRDAERGRGEDPRADGLLLLNMTTGRRNASSGRGSHEDAVGIVAEEGREAGADAAAIEKEGLDAHVEEEGLDAADHRGRVFAAVAVILAVALAVETLAYAAVAIEAGAFAGAFGAADGDDAGAFEAAGHDDWRALADAILAAEGDEAGAIEEEGLDANDHRALLFAAVGVILAVIVAVATVAYTPPAAGRATGYPGAAFPTYIPDHLFSGGTRIAGGTGHLNHFTPGLYTNLHQLQQENARLTWFTRRQIYHIGWGNIFVTVALYLLRFRPMLGVTDLVLLLGIALSVLVLLFV